MIVEQQVGLAREPPPAPRPRSEEYRRLIHGGLRLARWATAVIRARGGYKWQQALGLSDEEMEKEFTKAVEYMSDMVIRNAAATDLIQRGIPDGEVKGIAEVFQELEDQAMAEVIRVIRGEADK